MTASCQQRQDIARLYSDHQAWIGHWLRRRLVNSADAPDLLQSTFEQVLLKPRPALEATEPRGWLTAIARHLLIDHQRRQRMEQAFRASLASLPEACLPSAEEQLLILESVIRLDAMLNGLGPKVRTAFLLSRLDGLTYPEIARQMGVSLRSVENYMAKAIAHCSAIRRQLEP